MATIVGSVPLATLEAAKRHDLDIKEALRRAEVRRRFKRVQRLNREAERQAQGWEPGFHNRVKGLRALVGR